MLRFIRRTLCTLFLSFLAGAPSSALAQVRNVDVEVFTGQPFGVARITVPLSGPAAAAALQTNSFSLAADDHRVLYPVFTTGRILTALRDFTGDESVPPRLTVLFLFTGNEPFDVTLHVPTTTSLSIRPREQPRAHSRLLRRWWREYTAAVHRQDMRGDYPPLIETYLTHTLSRRLNLALPPVIRNQEEDLEEPLRSMAMLLGTEAKRMALLHEALADRPTGERADLPLPEHLVWSPVPIPAVPDDVEIEPIAMHVPEECFYIRFGRFNNYLWMSHLLEEYGGDLSRMVKLRAHDLRLSERTQQQLALKEGALAELLGETIIADVAMIGRDTYMREGASIGILFHAKNNLLLRTDFQRQRAEALRHFADYDAVETTVEIGGHEVSFISTPDNRLRSFYAADGDFHLVTTSRTIVERFFAAGAGERPLGASDEFRYARAQTPLHSNDTIFVYLSRPFLRGLVSPSYRIELSRRLQSVAQIELLQLARLTSRAEGNELTDIDDLVAAGFLPRGFGQRPEGGSLLDRDGNLVDSLRGARGSFLPIADMTVETATRSERAEAAALAAWQIKNWQQMDPIVISVKRFELEEEGLERVVIDTHIMPLSQGKYEWFTSMLGPPQREFVAPHSDDVIHFNAILKGGRLRPGVDVHHLFIGVQDILPDPTLGQDGLMRNLKLLTQTPGYLGAWPEPGLIDVLPIIRLFESDLAGYTRLPLGLWRWQGGDYSVVSFDRRVLERVTPRLHFHEAEQPAQMRLTIGDLRSTNIAPLASAINYDRAWQASLGNLRLLHTLSQQLAVPRAEALTTAETLLDVRLICPLGGTYEFSETAGGFQQWQSTAWEPGSTPLPPEDYVSPFFTWFRGARADLNVDPSGVVLHAEIDMQRRVEERGFQLPRFPGLLGGE